MPLPGGWWLEADLYRSALTRRNSRNAPATRPLAIASIFVCHILGRHVRKVHSPGVFRWELVGREVPPTRIRGKEHLPLRARKDPATKAPRQRIFVQGGLCNGLGRHYMPPEVTRNVFHISGPAMLRERYHFERSESRWEAFHDVAQILRERREMSGRRQSGGRAGRGFRRESLWERRHGWTGWRGMAT